MNEDHELPTIKLKFLKRKSLLAIIQNSIKGGDNYLFRNTYARDENGREIDILEDGRNSCAAFVSWILLTVELIKGPHATVESTEKDLIDRGWYAINDPVPGAVLVWEARKSNDKLLGEYESEHRHIGFYVGNNEAISNSSRDTGFPSRHSYNYNNSRKIEKIYWHDSLND